MQNVHKGSSKYPVVTKTSNGTYDYHQAYEKNHQAYGKSHQAYEKNHQAYEKRQNTKGTGSTGSVGTGTGSSSTVSISSGRSSNGGTQSIHAFGGSFEDHGNGHVVFVPDASSTPIIINTRSTHDTTKNKIKEVDEASEHGLPRQRQGSWTISHDGIRFDGSVPVSRSPSVKPSATPSATPAATPSPLSTPAAKVRRAEGETGSHRRLRGWGGRISKEDGLRAEPNFTFNFEAPPDVDANAATPAVETPAVQAPAVQTPTAETPSISLKTPSATPTPIPKRSLQSGLKERSADSASPEFLDIPINVSALGGDNENNGGIVNDSPRDTPVEMSSKFNRKFSQTSKRDHYEHHEESYAPPATPTYHATNYKKKEYY